MAFTKVLPSGISSTSTAVFDSINTVGVITASSIVATTGTFSVAGVGTIRIGIGTTALLVDGNARVTGILTVGSSSITLDGNSNQVNVGTGVTLHHTNGVQVGSNTFHSSGLTLNTLNVGTNGTSVTTTSNGHIGIGTTTPINKIQVFLNTPITVPSAGTSGHHAAIGDVGFGVAIGALNSGKSYIQGTRWDGTALNYDLLLQPNGGKIGIGTIPEAFHPNNKGVIRGDGGYFILGRNTNDSLIIAQNFYYDSSDNGKYIANGKASLYTQNNGEHVFYGAASGTANNIAVQSERVRVSYAGTMTLRATGGVFIQGYNADDNQLDIAKLSRMGYATNYKNLIIGKHLPNSTSYTYQSISLNYDPNTNASGNFNGAGNEIFVPNNNQSIAHYTRIKQPTVANNNFNDLIVFGDNGQVMKPNQPGFRVYYPTGAANSIITFGATEYNIGNHMNAATGVFTAPIAGRYLFTFAILSGNPMGSYVRIGFCKNSTTMDTTFGDALWDGLSSYGSPSIAMIINLAVNDTIRLRTEGSGVYGTSYGSFSGILLA